MAALSDLGNGGVAADHRHDALVLVPEGLRALLVPLAQYVLGRPATRLLRHRPQLRKRGAVVGRDVGHVADGIDPGVPIDREVREHVEASATAGLGAGPLHDLGTRLATAPHDGPGHDRRPVVELDPIAVHGRDADAEPGRDPSLGQPLEGVPARLAAERGEQGGPAVDDGDLARSVDSTRGVQGVHQLCERARGLDSGRTAADHHDVEAAVALVRRGPRILQQSTQVATESFRVGDRVERERVLGRARHAEEVRPGTGRQDQVGPSHGAAVGQSHDPVGQVDAGDLRRQHLHGGVLPEDRAVRSGDVLRRQL